MRPEGCEVKAGKSGIRTINGYFITGVAHSDPTIIKKSAEDADVSIKAIAGKEGCYEVTLTDDKVRDVVDADAKMINSVSDVSHLTDAIPTYEAQGILSSLVINEYAKFFIATYNSVTRNVEHVPGKLVRFEATYVEK